MTSSPRQPWPLALLLGAAIGLGSAHRRPTPALPLSAVAVPDAARAVAPPAAYDVLVYGGSFAGFAAIRTLKRAQPEARVLWVVPQDRLGEIGTVGGQCFWDMFQGRDGYYGGT